MGRHKTISDHDVLRIARDVFREHGHTATTRQIADAAGISEAVLYQRFGSKDDLFFAAMHPRGPDIDDLLGPKEPPADAHAYLHTVVARLRKYFGEVIPLALHVMTHPSFDPGSLTRAQPNAAGALREGLAERLAAFTRRKQLAMPSEDIAARLLVSLAHDWALGRVLTPGRAHDERDLKAMVDLIWEGLRAR
jgi:AcrR family transcriptional regulator